MTHFLLLLLTLAIFPIAAFSLRATKITVGSSIEASQNSTPWRSPTGDFAFGFQCPNNDTKNFVIAVWFEVVPDQTMAWFARTQVPPGSILTLESNGFILRNTQGKLLYKVTGDLKGQVAHAELTDAGNLVLSKADSSDHLWESFKNPTDTILPTQALVIGQQLISKKSEFNFTLGRFYGSITTDGNFTLNTKTIPTNSDFENMYYNSHTPSGARLSFSKNSDISVVENTGEIIKTLLSSNLTNSSEYYFRATLEFDGVFSLYYFTKNLYSWIEAGTLPENACMSISGDKGSGACGFNNVCRLVNSRPSCNCTEGFSLVDQQNPYGDCKSNLTGSCGGHEYTLVEVKDVDWPFNDYEQMNPSTLEECRSACSVDNFCEASIFRSNSCWKKRMPLSNGRVDTSLNATAFLKVRKG